MPTSLLTGTSKLQDSNEHLNLLMQSRSAHRSPIPGALPPTPPPPRTSLPLSVPEHVGGGGNRRPAPPCNTRPRPGTARPPPRSRSADLARRPAPRPPPCFRSPGSASPAPRGSRGGREVMQGADYHEKGCAWKSLLHATVSLTKGGWWWWWKKRGSGGVTRKLAAS